MIVIEFFDVGMVLKNVFNGKESSPIEEGFLS